MRDDLTPIDTTNFPKIDISDAMYNIAAQEINSALDVDKITNIINPENTTPYKLLQETKQINENTNVILSRHNAELVNLARQVEELQKNRANLSEINENLKKELAESRKELKKSRRDRIIHYVISGVAIIIALLTWLFPIK